MITPNEARKYVETWVIKRKIVSQKIEVAARGVIPVLKDAGRTHSAAELDALFFELDAVDQEAQQMVADNLDAAIEAMLARVPKP